MNYARVVAWIVVFAVAAIVAIAATIAGMGGGRYASDRLSQKPVALQNGTWIKPPRELALGQFTDVDGQTFGNAQWRGRPSLVFVGYTSCPDICPTTLSILREVQLHSSTPELRVVFITVDPLRDTPRALKASLGNFDNAFIGLRADPLALTLLLKELGAVAANVTGSGASTLIDHSATVYLLDSGARLRAVFTPPLNAKRINADLRTVMPRSAL